MIVTFYSYKGIEDHNIIIGYIIAINTSYVVGQRLQSSTAHYNDLLRILEYYYLAGHNKYQVEIPCKTSLRPQI